VEYVRQYIDLLYQIDGLNGVWSLQIQVVYSEIPKFLSF
jgi:hypothetical protein